MSLKARRFFGTVTTSGANLFNIQLPRSARLVGIEATVYGVAGAAVDAYGVVEISRVNQSGLATNDAQNSIATIGWHANVASAGFSTNKVIPGLGLDFLAGDYIYVNCVRNGTVPTTCTFFATVYLVE